MWHNPLIIIHYFSGIATVMSVFHVLFSVPNHIYFSKYAFRLLPIIITQDSERLYRFYSVCGGFMWYVLLIYLSEEHRNNINSKCNDRRNNGSDLPDVILFVHLCFFFQSWLFNLMRSHQSVSVLPQ